MKFINPYEMLDIEDFDSSSVKKAKKRKLAEIRLSDDGNIKYSNTSVDESSFNNILNKLDDPNSAHFYQQLLRDPLLSNFLKEGDTEFFEEQSTLSWTNSFIEFISPYFTYQFDKLFFQAYNEGNLYLIKKLSSHDSCIKITPTDKLYSKTYLKLKEISDSLYSTTRQVEDKYDEYSIGSVFVHIKKLVDVKLLNLLPDYFQSVRNSIGESIRGISVGIWNGHGNAKLAYQVLDWGRSIKTNGLSTSKISKAYEQISEIYREKQEEEKYSAELKKYASILVEINQLETRLENKYITPQGLDSKIRNLVPIYELNKLPDLFLQIRSAIAMGIRQLSISSWNHHQNIQIAIELLNIAKKITIPYELKQRLNEDAQTLSGLKDAVADDVVEALQTMNGVLRRVALSYDQVVNTSKVAEFVLDLFSTNTVAQLSQTSVSARHKVLNELKKILAVLPNRDNNRIVDRLKPLGNGSAEIMSKLTSMKKQVYSGRSSTPTSSGSSSSSVSKGGSNSPTWAEKNPGCIVSLALLGIGGLLVMNEESAGVGVFFLFAGFIVGKASS